MARKSPDIVSVPEFVNRVMTAAEIKTQNEFAEKVGVTQSTVSKWLRELQSPNLAQWNGVLDYVRSNPKTRHLLILAPDVSLDGMVAPYSSEVQANARTVLEAFLKTVPKP